ncbi:hypothetical protein TNCT_703551 [Trichonephila clavata]|uniref:Uncharacterized protein n=1 Tax=Trichonephila clavata TaxID=2740835 RepID=A0A8X6GJT1_TRICU|nr:hypothetical protein TNCT_703551 [Trichonephila clavata]
MIRIKILLQEIWEGGFDCDEELGKKLRTEWKKWCKEVHSLVDLSIPRKLAKKEILPQETTNEERRVEYIAINYSNEFQNEEPILDIDDVISISNVFRITTWIRRFINNMKLKKRYRIKNPLKAEDIEVVINSHPIIYIDSDPTGNFP